MPKSTKKQKEKAADFTKARLKLGKGKKPAPNAVDTSFKARAIVLPNQSILVDKSQAGPSTRRKQTLDELLSLLKHYSPGTRRDALAGLRELFSEHPGILEPSIASVVQGCSRLIGDEDTTVRKSLISFIEWLLPQIPNTNLTPHMPSLLLYTTSAQTHIFPEIRVDSVQLLDILLQVVPECVVLRGPSDHGDRILQGYLGLLNISARQKDDQDAAPPSGVVLSAASKLLVLNSLNTFLELSISVANTTQADEEPWFLASSFATEAAYQNFIRTIQPLRHSQCLGKPASLLWQDRIDASISAPFFSLVEGARPWSAFDLDSVEGLPSSLDSMHTSDDYTERMSSLARSLQPTLISTFLDNAPAAFISTSSSSKSLIIETKLVHVVGRLAKALYSPILRQFSLIDDASCDGLDTFVNHLSTYFPFGCETRHPQAEDILHELNLIYCELASLLILHKQLLARVESSQASTTRQFKGMMSDATSVRLGRISDWVAKALSGQLKYTSKPMGQQLTPQSCRSLLPTVWALLNQHTNNSVPQPDQTTVPVKILISLFDQWENAGSSSAVKRVLLEIIAYLALLETDPLYTGGFRMTIELPSNAVVPYLLPSKKVKLFADWVLTLPRMAWELGVSKPTTTEIIFSFLLRALQRKSIIFDDSVLVQLMQRLTPYFSVNHPTRGFVMGPFTKLPEEDIGKRSNVRHLVLDTVWTLAQTSALQPASRQSKTRPPGESIVREASRQGLCTSVMSATRGTSEESYWSTLCVQPV